MTPSLESLSDLIDVPGRCRECQDDSGTMNIQQLQQSADSHWDRVHARQLKKALRISKKEAPAYARAQGFENEEAARQMSLQGTEDDFDRQLEKARMESLESAFEYFRTRRDRGIGSGYAGSAISGESIHGPYAGPSRRRDKSTIYEESGEDEYEPVVSPSRPSRLASMCRKAAEKLRVGPAAQGRRREPVFDGLTDCVATSRESRRSEKAPSRVPSAAGGFYRSEAGSLRHGSESGEELEDEAVDDSGSTGTLRPAQHISQQYDGEEDHHARAQQQWAPQPLGNPYNAQQPQPPMPGQQPGFSGNPSQPGSTWQFPGQPLRSPSPAATLHRVMSQHGDEESRRQGLFTNHPYRPPTGLPASVVGSNVAGLGVEEEGGEGGEWESEVDIEADEVEEDADSAYTASAAPSAAAPSVLHTDRDGYGSSTGRPPAYPPSGTSRR
ncbi:hypothetical protein LTR86_001969 [Recurvomyces mirabilis]|nr:hypothetical protein LTR86_001969 [Recurvomyces mirabilis]